MKKLWFTASLLILIQVSLAFATNDCAHSFRNATPYSEHMVSNAMVLECEYCGEIREIHFAKAEGVNSGSNDTPYSMRIFPNRVLMRERIDKISKLLSHGKNSIWRIEYCQYSAY